jgi:hypothetical protein
LRKLWWVRDFVKLPIFPVLTPLSLVISLDTAPLLKAPGRQDGNFTNVF